MDIGELAYECEKRIDTGDVNKILAFTSIVAEHIQPEQTVDKVVYCYYFLGNLHSAASSILRESASSWRSNIFPANKVDAINAFRMAERIAIKIGSPILCEIETNLANEMAHQRRNFECLEKWRCNFNVIGDSPFVSSLSKAKELLWVRHWLDDEGHSNSYYFSAYILLNNLRLNLKHTDHPDIVDMMKNDQEIISVLRFGDENQELIFNWDKNNLPDSMCKDEKTYRRWCLDNRLFVNPLNDITDQFIADQDILQFPSHKVKIGGGPFLSAAFSSIKREFCFARFLAYEGFHEIHPDYENKKLYLTDTLDDVRYDGSLEKIKAAFRVCFSTLDSLASLMNKYFKCDHRRPEFKPSWIKENLSSFENHFIDALYWLSCDLTDAQTIPADKWKAPNPSSAKIRQLRNAVEHGWLRVSEAAGTVWDRDNDYALNVSSGELKESTMVVLKTVRCALIYFCLAVKFQETTERDFSKKDLYVSQMTPLVDDDFI